MEMESMEDEMMDLDAEEGEDSYDEESESEDIPATVKRVPEKKDNIVQKVEKKAPVVQDSDSEEDSDDEDDKLAAGSSDEEDSDDEEEVDLAKVMAAKAKQ